MANARDYYREARDAISNGNEPAFQKIVEESQLDSTSLAKLLALSVDGGGEYSITNPATKAQRKKIDDWLVCEKKVDPSMALHSVCTVPGVHHLVQYKADVNHLQKIEQGLFKGHITTPLFDAFEGRNHNTHGVIRALLEHKADANMAAKGIRLRFPLQQALGRHYASIGPLINAMTITDEVIVETVNSIGTHAHATYKDFDNVNNKDFNDTKEVLHYELRRNKKRTRVSDEIMRLIPLKPSVDPNSEKYQTPPKKLKTEFSQQQPYLDDAAMKDDIEFARYLVKEAKVQRDQKTLGDALVEVRSIEMLDFLLQQGADINYVTRFNKSLLIRAIEDGRDIALIVYAIKKGANVNYVSDALKIGIDSPLSLAVTKQDRAYIDVLLAFGADPEKCYFKNYNVFNHDIFAVCMAYLNNSIFNKQKVVAQQVHETCHLLPEIAGLVSQFDIAEIDPEKAIAKSESRYKL